MDIEIEYKLKRIGENLFLNLDEKDKLFEMYRNSNPDTRDGIVNEIEKQSKVKDISVLHELKQRIRKS